jgi:hypothetical protein
MKSYPSLIGLLLTVLAAAQEPAFDGKIELRAPARSSWVITFKPAKAMHVKESGKSRSASIEDLQMTPVGPTQVLTSLTVEKSNDLYFELSRFSDGTTSQKWSSGAVQFRELKGGALVAMAAMNLRDPDYSDHSQEDFEELGWLSKDFYKGVITYQNQPCFLFQTTTDKRPPTRRDRAASPQRLQADPMNARLKESEGEVQEAPKPSASPVEVIISAASRLPLVYNDGQTLRTYSYKTSGLEPLVPPEKFAREFAAWRKYAAERNRAPVAP